MFGCKQGKRAKGQQGTRAQGAAAQKKGTRAQGEPLLVALQRQEANEITNKKDKALRLEQKSTFIISKQEDVNKLIAILDKYGPLNTTKYLEFLSWKKAFLLYISRKEKSIIEKESIKS